MALVPEWLNLAAWTWIVLCLSSAVFLLVHTIAHPQKMTVMSVVWPVTGLYLGPVAVYAYRRSLPVMKRGPMPPAVKVLAEKSSARPPTFLQNSIAVFHCGAGCSIGDVIAESIAPSLAPTLGLTFAGAFGSRLILDFVFAYVLGIVFQYFTVAPMRGLSLGQGIVAAARADTVSIVMFQVGMFGWMAIAWFVLFPAPHLNAGMAVFWFMMQIAMVTGFFTALPANAWLIRKGWKEKMPQVDPAEARRVAEDGIELEPFCGRPSPQAKS